MPPSPVPSVTLDYTLRDLYGKDSNLVFVFAFPTPRGQTASPLPVSRKFTYQSPLGHVNDSDEAARQCLHNIPLRYASVVGKMPLILLDLDSDSDGKKQHHDDAFHVLSQLCPEQRPDLRFVKSLDDIRLSGNERIVILNPLDRLEHLPHSVDPEIHYDLLSKRGLAYSGLPTPPSMVVDSIIAPENVCHSSLVDEEVERMIRPVREQKLPFIVKLPQAISSQGTFLIRAEYERKAAEKVLAEELPQMLQDLSSSNQHLHPCCLVLQKFLPGDSVAISIFVTEDGQGIFIGCTQQAFDDTGLWAGGFISYNEQSNLQQKYSDIINQVATFLHGKGYHGPAGADIMTDLQGRHLVIDLNVRVTGSYNLGCLRGHFLSRGLCEAVLLYPIRIHCSREEFLAEFAREWLNGSLVVSAWTEGVSDGTSMGAFCVAGVDKLGLKRFTATVRAFVALKEYQAETK